MSTMPAGDAAGQQGGAEHGIHPGAPAQAGAPGQEQGTAQPGDAGYPAYQRAAAPPAVTPPVVTRADTRVTGRRVVQYLIDAFLVGLVPSLASIPFDRSNSTFVHVIGAIVAFIVFAAIGFLYWVLFTHRQDGQTLGMKLLSLRVISKGGGPANMAQLTIRWVCLILDAIPYTWPLTGLVGFIVILCSRDRQRIGDHLGRTLVVRADTPVGGGSRHARLRCHALRACHARYGVIRRQSHASDSGYR